MHTRTPYYYLLVVVPFFSLVLHSCGQPNQEVGNIEASSASEQLINATGQVLSPSYGPFIASSGDLVTLQQQEGSWTARVQKAGTLVREQHLDVDCTEDIAKTLSQLQHQPADYVKSRIHVLSPAQSPTGKGAIYLGELGLSSGMEQGEKENDTSTLISLHQAAQEGNLTAIKYLVEEKRADVNAQDNQGTAALHLAAFEGHLAVIKYLVEKKKADVNAQNNKGVTALHLAAQEGHLAVIKYLLEEKKVDVKVQNNKGATVLHLAAFNGHLAIIKYLVEEKKIDVNALANHKMTALHWAAQEGHLAIIEYLVGEKKADVNARDDQGATALHYAAEEGHLTAIQYLIEKKADVNAQNNQGATVLHRAVFKKHMAVIKYLVEEKKADVNTRDNQRRTALHWAAFKGYLAIIEYLVEEKQADVSARDNQGATALHWAAQEGHQVVVQYLVEKRANVSAQDNRGATALHWAAREGHLAIIKYLVEEKRADANAQDNQGAIALHWATFKGDLEVVEYLVEEQKTDVNAQDNQGATALHWAAREGHLVVIKYLVEEKSVDVNARDNQGITGLHLAAYQENMGVVEYLVEEQKADVNAQDNQGTTALHWAVLKGHLAVIQYLVEKRADVNARDNRRRTALHWAAQEGNMEIILYLMEEAKGCNNPQIIEDLRHPCFEQWENIRPYARLLTIADKLCSKGAFQTLHQEKVSTITDASLRLKLAYKGQEQKPRKECAYDLGTAFSNRFKNKALREGIPEAILLDSEKYFKNILLPDSLRAKLQTFVEQEKEKKRVTESKAQLAMRQSTQKTEQLTKLAEDVEYFTEERAEFEAQMHTAGLPQKGWKALKNQLKTSASRTEVYGFTITAARSSEGFAKQQEDSVVQQQNSISTISQSNQAQQRNDNQLAPDIMESRRNVAISLLIANFSIGLISSATGLTQEEVEEIQREEALVPQEVAVDRASEEEDDVTSITNSVFDVSTQFNFDFTESGELE